MTVKQIQDIVNQQSIQVYDARTMPYADQGITHFALVDSLMNEVGRTGQHILHFWPTKPLVFLGMQDTRLPYLDDALDVLEANHYDYIVRNSGGLGVVSDQGILNLSLIIPNEDMGDISIDEGYEMMYALLKEVIPAPLEAVEIPDSYCPGDFDLSIKGQKISGISQRRRAGSLAIMLYLSIEGDQDKRSLMMKDFYEQGLKGETSQWHYPNIKPEVMVNLDQALGRTISVDDVQATIFEVLKDMGATMQEGGYHARIQADFETEMEAMVRRNQRMLGDRFQA